MKVVTIHIPKYYIEIMDELVSMRLFHSRADVIRAAIRYFIDKEYDTLVEFASHRQK